jgi:Arc/MetJ-type ribon-helix-helix transcriptional regulator
MIAIAVTGDAGQLRRLSASGIFENMANEFRDIIVRLERQRKAIDRALAALREVDGSETGNTTPRKKGPAKRTVSAEARKRMADAQRKRWAGKKKAQKKAGRTGAKGVESV